MQANIRRPRPPMKKQTGATLVETMVALVIGLAITSAALSSYMGNRAAFRQIEGVARLQESARIAASLLESDIRQAGGSVCRNNLPLSNVVNSQAWWAQPANGIQGFESIVADVGDSNTYPRQAGTDSITIWSANSGPITQVRSVASAGGSTTFTVDTTANLPQGTLAVVCDYSRAALFQVSSVSAANNTITIDTGNGTSPGNSSSNLGGVAPNCANGSQTCAFGPGSLISPLIAHHWYISNKVATTNGSLNNLALRRNTIVYTQAGAASASSDEILENVSDLQVTYLQGNASMRPASSAYVGATQITNWSQVLAARMVLTLRSTEAIATGAAGAASAATYQVPVTVAIRSRSP